MKSLKFTLIADGSSDETLLKIIKWSLDFHWPKLATEGIFADFRRIPNPPKTIKDKISLAKKIYPFDIVFIHRDAENNNTKMIQQRISEVKRDLSESDFEKTIFVVPIKMMETWLLIDALAIKTASGNRNYSGVLQLPPVNQLENEKQPKQTLHDLLRLASCKKGRELKKFNTDKAVHLVADNISDFSPLRNLKAFCHFEDNLKKVINSHIKTNNSSIA